ncbi:MAG: M56 family metallopeptidase [Gemmatimonadaceae bacterium]
MLARAAGFLLPMLGWSTMVVTVAGVANLLLRRSSAALRDLVWRTALVALLVMPVAALTGPPTILRLRPPTAVARVTTPMRAPVANAIARMAPRARSFNWAGLAAALWLGGAALFVVRIGRAVVTARSWRRRATPFPRDHLLEDRVTLLVSHDTDVPLLVGVLNPAILLPASVPEWSDDELHLVLLHERAHATRSDVAMRIVALTARAAYWLNPLVWWMTSRHQAETELAADELVLAAGTPAVEYATTLLSLAERVRWVPSSALTVQFARPGTLGHRIHAILQCEARAKMPSASTQRAILASACVVATLAGCVRVAAATVELTPAPPPPPLVSAKDWRTDAVRELILVLRDTSAHVRYAAAQSLGQLGDVSAVPYLNPLLRDADKNVGLAARDALRELARHR